MTDTVLTKLSDPDVLPSGNGFSIAWTDDRSYLAYGNSDAPTQLSLYKRAGLSLVKLPDPAAPPPRTEGLEWTRDGTYLAASLFNGAVRLWWGKRAGDVLTKLADPATMPPGNGAFGVSWTSDGQLLAISGQGLALQPAWCFVYQRSGDTLTFLASAPNIPNHGSGFGQAEDCSWTPDGAYLAVGANTGAAALKFSWYSFNGIILTQLADPVQPAGNVFACEWSEDGVYLAMGHGNLPNLTVYKRSGNTLAKLADPIGVIPDVLAEGISWTRDTKSVAIARDTDDETIVWYNRFGDVFTKVAVADVGAGSGSRACDWTPDGALLAAASVLSPYIDWWSTPFFRSQRPIRHVGPAGSEFLDKVTPDSKVGPFKT